MGLWASQGGPPVGVGVGLSHLGPLLFRSSFPSSERQTCLHRGPLLPAEPRPPARREGEPARGAGQAQGCAPWGGARGAHPGAEVHLCSLSRAINKCSGESSWPRGSSGPGSGGTAGFLQPDGRSSPNRASCSEGTRASRGRSMAPRARRRQHRPDSRPWGLAGLQGPPS